MPVPSVLLVDDHDANLVALEAVLAPLGYRLIRATSGEMALTRLMNEPFAVILLDVVMPGLNGFETAALIKQRTRTRDIPIVFLSALSIERGDLIKGYVHGGADYLVKPFEPAVLCAKVAVFVDLFVRGEEINRQAVLLAEQRSEALERARHLAEVEYERGEQERLAREAQRAVRSRDDLLATVSHDLRSPLGTIAMAAGMLRRAADGGLEASAVARHTAAIERSVQRMDGLIRDLLDIASIESGHLSVEFEPVRTGDLLHEAIELLESVAIEKGLRLEAAITADLLAQCDRGRLLQVFGNLVGNAIKFTPAGGSIVIRVERPGHRIRFSVSDTGPGIAPEQLPLVFDRFWKAEETARAGTGLGLAICKGIVEQHGGRIWVESRLGEGTTFFFTIPVADPVDSVSERESTP
jgi:signal transduction histidine kinase